MEKRSILLTSVMLALGLTACTDASNTGKELAPTSAKYQLRWTPPVGRVDGTALAESDIAGYHIRWFKEGSDESDIIELDASSTSHLVELAPGNYRFEIAAVDSTGRLSQFVAPN